MNIFNTDYNGNTANIRATLLQCKTRIEVEALKLNNQRAFTDPVLRGLYRDTLDSIGRITSNQEGWEGGASYTEQAI